MFKTLTAVALVLTAGLAAAQDYQAAPRLQPEQQEQIRQAVGNPHRTISNLMRDAGRNPEQTLSFFAVEPQHTVVEVWPGAGWYTEILAPLLREQGRYIAAHFDPQSPVGYFRQSRASFEEKLAGKPDVYDKVEVTVLNYEPDVAMAPPESADRVLTFRNVHNWLAEGEEQAAVVFAKMYAALKPGGLLGLVEHRARIGTDLETMTKTGYVTEELVVQLAEQAGFELVGRSPVNQNPRDTTDHPEGVWTLPPTLRLGDENRAQYLAIGESDRMTLLFIKR
ncbi:methyltransferase [Halopseudomonas sp. Lyrl_26]|uniref:class I SAM-dependent methyltransferase n=1 Tax=Halopseudomonas sp. Lyrl_26 TaxID=3110923 RepID=UPI003F811244